MAISLNADGECKGNFQDDSARGHSMQWTKALIMRPAPHFEGTGVVNGELNKISLKDFKGKYLVLVFIPNAFTFVCPTELLAFNDRIKEFRDINTEILGISVDSAFTNLAWQGVKRSEGGVGHLDIPMLSDPTHSICKDYGVYLEEMGHSLRGLFIIDSNGILRQITMNDLPVGRSVDETLRLVQAFQFTDSNPSKVCPANWKPGKATIIPDPKKKLEYFAAQNKNEL